VLNAPAVDNDRFRDYLTLELSHLRRDLALGWVSESVEHGHILHVGILGHERGVGGHKALMLGHIQIHHAVYLKPVTLQYGLGEPERAVSDVLLLGVYGFGYAGSAITVHSVLLHSRNDQIILGRVQACGHVRSEQLHDDYLRGFADIGVEIAYVLTVNIALLDEK